MRNFLDKNHQYILNFASDDIGADFTPPYQNVTKIAIFQTKRKPRQNKNIQAYRFEQTARK